MRQLLLICLFIPFFSFSQTQIGSDIDGEAIGDLSGHSVSLSSDGSIVAIGARFNGGNGNTAGHVRIYENQSGSWVQIGSDIDGEAIGDHSGHSVSLSSDGSIVAIGARFNNGNGDNSGHVRIYENQSGDWVQIGSDIDGEAISDESGYSVSLSSNGSIVAVGAPGNDGNGSGAGHVRVYENQSGSWVQIGSDIDGEAATDQSGHSVSLSSNGSIVAIGAYYNDGNSFNSGHVRVYENQSGNWVQIGSDIDGEASNDLSGHSVSLSSNGSIVAIGSYYNAANGNYSGHVRVYENQSGSWVQIGSDIDGEAISDESGYSVSLSSDGSIVAIGARYNDANGSNSGHVRVYENQSGSWVRIGSDIDGEASGDQLGYSIGLSTDGSIMAIGAPGFTTIAGYVRVYDLNAVLSTESFNKDYFSMYPNPVKDVLNISLNEGLELKQVNIYNILSQYLYSTKELRIDTNNLKSGIYFVEIVTNQGKSAKKIVVE